MPWIFGVEHLCYHDYCNSVELFLLQVSCVSNCLRAFMLINTVWQVFCGLTFLCRKLVFIGNPIGIEPEPMLNILVLISIGYLGIPIPIYSDYSH